MVDFLYLWREVGVLQNWWALFSFEKNGLTRVSINVHLYLDNIYTNRAGPLLRIFIFSLQKQPWKLHTTQIH